MTVKDSVPTARAIGTRPVGQALAGPLFDRADNFFFERARIVVVKAIYHMLP